MSNIIHPTAIIGPNVKLGDNNYIGPYCVFSGKIEILNNNFFARNVSIGSPPQHRNFKLDIAQLENIGTIKIGSSNYFYEFTTIHQPYNKYTIVGSDCFVMPYTNISHDATLEDSVTLSSNVQIGGHSILMKGCNIGFSTSIHQFRVIGSYTMIGMGSLVLRHVIPFNKFSGVGPNRMGLNDIGLSRAGISQDDINTLDKWSLSYLNGEKLQLPTALEKELERYETNLKKVSQKN